MRSSVVFPEPLEPINACVTPLGTVRFTSARTGRPSKFLWMFCSSSMTTTLATTEDGLRLRLSGDDSDFDPIFGGSQLGAHHRRARGGFARNHPRLPDGVHLRESRHV